MKAVARNLEALEEKPLMQGPSAEAHDALLAARGDVASFERLYRAHSPRIYGLCRRMLGESEADEITQVVFVRVWEKLGSFQGKAAFGTWLYRVAINVILGRRRELGIQRDRIEDSETWMDTATAPAARTDLAMDFEGAIAELPAGCRQIFVLHDVEGFKHEEIADKLGITSGTSKSQLHRARMMLRRHLGH